MNPTHRLTQAYLRGHPLEAARLLESQPPDEAAIMLEPLPTEDIANVIEHILPDPAAAILERLPISQAAEAIGALSASSALSTIRLLKPSVQGEVLDRLDRNIGASLRLALSYPENTAGSLADPRILCLPLDISATEALTRIAQSPAQATYYHYVLDREGRLAGVVTTKELLSAGPHALVAAVMQDEVVSLRADSRIEEATQHPHWRLFHTLPVVDHNGLFVGVLRYRTLRKLEQEHRGSTEAGQLPEALIALWQVSALVGIQLTADIAAALLGQWTRRRSEPTAHQGDRS